MVLLVACPQEPLVAQDAGVGPQATLALAPAAVVLVLGDLATLSATVTEGGNLGPKVDPTIAMAGAFLRKLASDIGLF